MHSKIAITLAAITSLLVPAYAVAHVDDLIIRMAMVYASLGGFIVAMMNVLPAYLASFRNGVEATVGNEAEWLREFSNELPQ